MGADKTKIRMTIESMNLPTSDQNDCFHFLEIKDYLAGSPGKLVCGNSGGGVFTKKLLGPSNMMIIRFDSETYSTVAPGTGFTFTVEAAPSACSSNPCKYPAMCTDGTTIDDYTCDCTDGYSGVNCDTIAASATVVESFEKDFSTLMELVKETQFTWSTTANPFFGQGQITPVDGSLVAELWNYFDAFGAPLAIGATAKMQTSVVFESADRCLRFNYVISDRNVGSSAVTSLNVYVMGDSGTTAPPYVFDTNTGNSWVQAEIDLPSMENMKIIFEGVNGEQELAVDNIRISPQKCDVGNPCTGIDCNNGQCVEDNESFQCQCDAGWSGDFCDIAVVAYTCDFEMVDESNCAFIESSNDDFDFTRNSGLTPTSLTGPVGAKTGTFYKYTEISGQLTGDVASLETSVSFNAGTYCLRFWASMYGKDIGSLSILTKDGTSPETLRRVFNGQQSSNWFLITEQLTLTSSDMIIIRTVRGGKNRNQERGDIALDNIVLTEGSCA